MTDRLATLIATLEAIRDGGHGSPCAEIGHALDRYREAGCGDAELIAKIPRPESDVLLKTPLVDSSVFNESDLCECDRPDCADDPHRHTLDMACVYWLAGRPSSEARRAVARQLWGGGDA